MSYTTPFRYELRLKKVKMLKLFILVIFLGFCQCTVLNNVRYLDHETYILDVLQKVVDEVEKRHWSSLRIPEISVPINETVFSEEYSGTVTYSNGFVTSIQHIEVLGSSVQQVWTWNATSQTATASFRGTLLLYELGLGFDVKGDLENGAHHYTALFTHALVRLVFHMNYNIHDDEMSFTVVGEVPTSNRWISFMPEDRFTEVLTFLFSPASTSPGIMAWGEEVFVPILKDVVPKVEFPKICYDCPA